jgi:chromate transporter
MTPAVDGAEKYRGKGRSLAEVGGLFLKLGCTSFGGPAVHIAMMEDEVVRRRGWLSREEFLDLLGATNLIPGPNSTEMAIHVGYRRAGWAGLVVAGASFIFPAVLIVTGLAWAYTRLGYLPQWRGALNGVKPVVVVIVFQALWGLGRSAVKSRALAIVALAAVLANARGVHELAVLAGGGAAVWLWRAMKEGRLGRVRPALLSVLPGIPLAAGGTPVAAAPLGTGPLFLFFLKVGSVLFGSGYVLLSFLRGGLVERGGWLTDAQLLDAVAVGQMTPGPVFTTATFIGYLLKGLPGAAAATAGIFLPAFVFVALSGPLIPRLRRSAGAAAVLDGVNAVSLALMAVVAVQLAAGSLRNGSAWIIAGMSALLLLRWKVNTSWLVLLGGAAGAVIPIFFEMSRTAVAVR